MTLNGAVLLKSAIGNDTHHLPHVSVECKSGWIPQSCPQQYSRVESISFRHLQGLSLTVTPVQVLPDPVHSESTGDRRSVNHLRKQHSSTVGLFWPVIHMDLSTAGTIGNKCFLAEKIRMLRVRFSCALHFAGRVT